MANDQDITIGLKTTGADAAAGEIRKVEAAVDKTKTATDELGTSEKKIGKEALQLEAEVKAVEKLGDEASATAGKVEDLIDKEKSLTQELKEATKAARENKEANDLRDEDVKKAKLNLAAKTPSAGGKGVHIATDQAAVQAAAEISGHGKEVTKALSVMGEETAAVASAVALEVGIGVAAIVASFAVPLMAFKAELDSLKETKKLAADAGIKLGDELEAEMAGLEATLNPFMGVIDTIKDKWTGLIDLVTHPVDTVTGLGPLKESLKQAAEAAKSLENTRQRIAGENQNELSQIYAGENERLKEQEETIKRIMRLRESFGSIEDQRAQNAVKIARQDGGDVAAAEVNALAVRLKNQLAKLTVELGQAQQMVEDASKAQDDALKKYNAGLRDKLKGAEMEALSKAVDDTQKNTATAKQVLTEQTALFTEQKKLVLENTEIAWRDLEEKYKGQFSKTADKGLKDLMGTVKEELDKGPPQVKQAIAQIQSDTSAIVNAAATKADEVAAAHQTATTGTVDAISKLMPNAKTQAAIHGAITDVGKAIGDQGAIVVAGFSQLMAAVNSVTDKLSNQQSQINQIQGRLR